MTRSKSPGPRRRPSGFTLVEIMVALVVVGLLAALLLPALASGLRSAKRAAVKAEISALAQGMADFKAKFGDYPPSRIYLSEDGWFPINSTVLVSSLMEPTADTVTTDITVGKLAQRSISALRRFFPKVTFSTNQAVFTSGSTTWYDFNGNGVFDSKPYILQGHECLAFFLGGIPLNSNGTYSMTGFGSNPSNPFTNSITSSTMYGANRINPFYEFVPGRLALDPTNPMGSGGNLMAPGIPGYYDSLGTVPDPSSSSATQLTGLNFFAYFSTSFLGGGYDPNDVNFDATENDGYLGYLFQGNAAISPGPNPYTSSTTNPATGTVGFINPQSFQIISAGFDGLYGIGGQYAPPPAVTPLPIDAANTTIKANTNANIEAVSDTTIRYRERDNITNFGTNSQLD